jgi:uncharacterized protein (TIGR02453 family)
MPKKRHFDKKLFAFLRDLKKNNNKAWFAANKARYETEVRDPLLAFITDFNAPLRKISEHYVADPRLVGGSMFRIYRDTRFSKDKTPYKTQASAHFRHEATSKDVHAPGFYLHLEPGNVFAGVGLWQPDAPSLSSIRTKIVDDGASWKKAAYGKTFLATWTLEGESLKRPPRGFDPNHPFAEDLKRKDFVAVTSFTEDGACDEGFLDAFATVCKASSPFMGFLSKAVGLPW